MKLKEIREVDLWKLFNIKVSSKFLNISVDDKKKKKKSTLICACQDLYVYTQ